MFVPVNPVVITTSRSVPEPTTSKNVVPTMVPVPVVKFHVPNDSLAYFIGVSAVAVVVKFWTANAALAPNTETSPTVVTIFFNIIQYSLVLQLKDLNRSFLLLLRTFLS